jgi:hypothetical protein
MNTKTLSGLPAIFQSANSMTLRNSPIVMAGRVRTVAAMKDKSQPGSAS